MWFSLMWVLLHDNIFPIMSAVDLSRYCRICMTLASLYHLPIFYPFFKICFHGAYPNYWPLSNLLSFYHIPGPLLRKANISMYGNIFDCVHYLRYRKHGARKKTDWQGMDPGRAGKASEMKRCLSLR
jgi:hypothetical protein